MGFIFRGRGWGLGEASCLAPLWSLATTKMSSRLIHRDFPIFSCLACWKAMALVSCLTQSTRMTGFALHLPGKPRKPNPPTPGCLLHTPLSPHGGSEGRERGHPAGLRFRTLCEQESATGRGVGVGILFPCEAVHSLVSKTAPLKTAPAVVPSWALPRGCNERQGSPRTFPHRASCGSSSTSRQVEWQRIRHCSQPSDRCKTSRSHSTSGQDLSTGSLQQPHSSAHSHALGRRWALPISRCPHPCPN